jgi:sugar-phosphatase
MPEALLLDFDRTLVDLQSYTDYTVAVASVESTVGAVDLIEVPETDWASDTHKAMAMLFALAGRPDRWQVVSDLIEQHEVAAVASATPMPGLAAFLAHTAGRPRAIVTLLGPVALDAACDRFSIEVDVRVARVRDLAPKPAPDQLLAACSALGADPGDAVMVGDSSWDEEASRAAGVRFIGVTNGGGSVFAPESTVADDLAAVAGLLV